MSVPSYSVAIHRCSGLVYQQMLLSGWNEDSKHFAQFYLLISPAASKRVDKDRVWLPVVFIRHSSGTIALVLQVCSMLTPALGSRLHACK